MDRSVPHYFVFTILLDSELWRRISRDALPIISDHSAIVLCLLFTSISERPRCR